MIGIRKTIQIKKKYAHHNASVLLIGYIRLHIVTDIKVTKKKNEIMQSLILV